MGKGKYDHLDWDEIYKVYRELVSNKKVVEVLNLPFSGDCLSAGLKYRGYKLRTHTEANKHKKWTEEKRKEHGTIMQEVVKKVPEKYLGIYKCGRVKTYEGVDSFGKKCYFIGTWEKTISELLTEVGINWQREPQSFEYNYLDTTHLYYPDFYLPDYDCFIEVKGIETEKDYIKWKVVPNLFLIRGSKEFYHYKVKNINLKDRIEAFIKQKSQLN